MIVCIHVEFFQWQERKIQIVAEVNFCCVADVPQLDHQYTVFGRVVQGMEFVDMIVNSPRDGRDNPHERVEMTAKMSTKGKVLD